MAVVRFHEDEHLAVLGDAVSATARQLDDPDALAGGTAVLLHYAGLEGDGLLEALQVRGLAVADDVPETEVHVRHGPHGNLREELYLILITLGLVASRGRVLPRVDAPDDAGELLEHLEEGVVLLQGLVAPSPSLILGR